MIRFVECPKCGLRVVLEPTDNPTHFRLQCKPCDVDIELAQAQILGDGVDWVAINGGFYYGPEAENVAFFALT